MARLVLQRWLANGLVVGLLGYSFLVSGFALAKPAAAPAALNDKQRALLVLNRLAFGPAPGDLDHVMHIGVDAWIDEQLHPERLPDPAALKSRLASLHTQQLGSIDLFDRYGPPARRAAGDDQAALDRVKDAQKQVVEETGEARLLHAIYSPAQLQEVMVDFWFNHFNVFIDKGQEGRIWTGAYEREAIRPYALGTFQQLLHATATHPAMLYYLDNWQSSVVRVDRKGDTHGLNENYAREVMELHTLGVDGGYTQHDVTELARILTGWTYEPKQMIDRQPPAYRFDPRRHDYEAKTFLGQYFPAGGGVEEGEHALDMLAASPSTAHHIAYELAQYFVADQPPPMLVERVAQRFLQTHGDIRSTLAALFSSPEFWDAGTFGDKFKTPYQYVVSSVRAAGLPTFINVRPLLNALRQEGEPLYGCLTPDGYKNTRAAWLNSDALIYRLNFANALGSGAIPLWQKPEDLPAPAQGMFAGLMNWSSDAKSPANPAPRPQPDPFVMEAALGNEFSLDTAEALAGARPQLRPGLILGSPEFMRR